MFASGQEQQRRGTLTSLLRDQRGNTVAIVAAAVIPLAAMVGSGVDMSRNYLVKSRLQQACDAGALAGRRAMGGSTWTTTTNNVARNFFKNNFVENSYGTTGLAYAFSEDDGTVSGTASVNVPTSIMKIFGYTNIPVAVSCSGKMKIPNTDIMFVLDTTGSMAQTNSGDSQNKLEGLKAAVRSFYTTLEGVKGPNTRVRYGFVPYSSNVNVGYLLQRDWMVDTAAYQSREKRFTGSYYTSTEEDGWDHIGGSYTDSTSYNQSSCPSDTYSYNDSASSETETDENGVITTVDTTVRVWTGRDYTCSGSGSNRTVKRRTYTNYTQRYVITTVKTPRYNWSYKQVSYDVSGLKGANGDGTMAGGSITAAIGNLNSRDQPTSRTVDWNGCIEERQTVRTSSFSPIPSGAIDMDIDRVPDSSDDSTRWRPSLGGLVFARAITINGSGYTSGTWNTATVNTSTNYANIEDYGSLGINACPSPARRLDEVANLTSLNQYLATLVAIGGTYHDIGMLWGARLISKDGLFGADNTSAPNGGEIARHVVFMTDGMTDPGAFSYTTYGLEPLDRRRVNSTSESDIQTNVEARFTALCTATKNKNITVWVVAFGTGMTTLLSNCASPGRSYQASNSAQLNTAFTSIATEIAQLRLVE